MNNNLYINRYLMLNQLYKNNPFNKDSDECKTIIANTSIKIKMKIDDEESTQAIYFKDLKSFVTDNEVLDVKVEKCPDDESLFCCILSISQNYHSNQLMSGEYPTYYYICDEDRNVTLKDSKEEWDNLILEIKESQPSLS